MPKSQINAKFIAANKALFDEHAALVKKYTKMANEIEAKLKKLKLPR